MDLKLIFSKQKLTNNLSLKLISLIVAIVMWVVVVNINDPVISQSYKNIPVKIVNAELITSQNQTIEVLDETDVVPSLSIKAQRSIIRELGTSSDNIVAIADMSNISLDGTSVPIEFQTVKYNDHIDSYKTSYDTLKVKIENRKEIQLPIVATATGDVESGYILGDIKMAQNQVRISGPESIVSTIKSATIEIPVTGFVENISSIAEIELLDENGETVDTSILNMNVREIVVDVEILATKRVPVFYSTMGNPLDGYGVTGEIECEPETIVIAGEKSVINSISEISVPYSELNITGQTDNLSALIDLKQYLPDGVRFGDSNFNGKANITVYIEPFVEETYAVYLKNIEIENVPVGYEASFISKDDYVEFTLRGLKQKLEKIQLSSLEYKVDFDDYTLLHDGEIKAGKYQLYLVLELPEGVLCDDVIELLVELKEE